MGPTGVFAFELVAFESKCEILQPLQLSIETNDVICRAYKLDSEDSFPSLLGVQHLFIPVPFSCEAGSGLGVFLWFC